MNSAAATPDESVSPKELAQDVIAFWNELTASSARTVFALVEELGLSIIQIKTLAAAAQEDGADLSVDALAERVDLPPASAVGTVEALSDRGWLRWDGGAGKPVVITPAGRAVNERLLAARLDGAQAYFAAVSPERRDRLSSALADLPRP